MNFIYKLGLGKNNTIPIDFIEQDSKQLLEEYLEMLIDPIFSEYRKKMLSHGYSSNEIIEETNVEIFAISSKIIEFKIQGTISNQHYMSSVKEERELKLVSHKYRKSVNEKGIELTEILIRDRDAYLRHMNSFNKPDPVPNGMTAKPEKKSWKEKLFNKS